MLTKFGLVEASCMLLLLLDTSYQFPGFDEILSWMHKAAVDLPEAMAFHACHTSWLCMYLWNHTKRISLVSRQPGKLFEILLQFCIPRNKIYPCIPNTKHKKFHIAARFSTHFLTSHLSIIGTRIDRMRAKLCRAILSCYNARTRSHLIGWKRHNHCRRDIIYKYWLHLEYTK